MNDISHVPLKGYGVPCVELWVLDSLHSYRGALFSCCALVRHNQGGVFRLCRTNPHRGGSK